MLSTLACVAFLVVQLVAHSGCDQTAFLVTPARLLVTLAGTTELPPPPKIISSNLLFSTVAMSAQVKQCLTYLLTYLLTYMNLNESLIQN